MGGEFPLTKARPNGVSGREGLQGDKAAGSLTEGDREGARDKEQKKRGKRGSTPVGGWAKKGKKDPSSQSGDTGEFGRSTGSNWELAVKLGKTSEVKGEKMEL